MVATVNSRLELTVRPVNGIKTHGWRGANRGYLLTREHRRPPVTREHHSGSTIKVLPYTHFVAPVQGRLAEGPASQHLLLQHTLPGELQHLLLQQTTFLAQQTAVVPLPQQV